MTDKVHSIPDDVLEQATAWLYRVEASPDDAALREELRRWTDEHETHARAWQVTIRAWTLTGKAKPAFVDPWTSGRPPFPATRRRSDAVGGSGVGRRRRKLIGVAAALAACLALFIALPDLRTWVEADFATGVGEVREITLEDGSVVYLGADSAATADFTVSERAIELLRGQAFFRVATDRARPFVVKADDLAVTVTGTAFDVRMTERTFYVAVAAGTVDIMSRGKREIGLSHGQRLTVDRLTGRMLRSDTREQDVALWRDGRLAVEGAAFDDVVDVIGRYHHGAIIIADASLRGHRVTGVYDLRDPVRALRALAGPYGSVVREVTPYLIVITGF